VIKNVVIRFRIGISVTNTHRHRYSKEDVDLTCPSCNEDEEDDVHFLLQCLVYEDLRSKYLEVTDQPTNKQKHL